MMPLLFALEQHKSLVEAQARMRGNEIVFAYLDDVHAACGPLRMASVHTSVEEELFTHANIRVHHGKTQVWNRGGVMPEGIEELTRARRVKPDAVAWKSRVDAQQGFDWPARVCARFPAEEEQGTRGFVQQNPRDQRSSGSLAPPLDVCFHEIEFLAKGGEARADRGFRRSS